MNISKLPSGSYRIKQMVNRKMYSITVPYKPSQKEAFNLLQNKINGVEVHKIVKFKDAATQYIDAKRNVLSPRTIREYGLYINRLPIWFIEMDINTLEQYDIQKCINELSANKSPKTIRCLHGFISAVLGMFRPQMVISTTLPQRQRIEPIIPIKSDVKELLDYTKKNYPSHYVGLFLASFGLRRSEICALKPEDLSKDNILTIDKALVQDEHGAWVVKTTKTTNSTRQIAIPKEIGDIIRKNNCVYPYKPNSLCNYLVRTQNKLGMKHFSIHKLRHYFASELSAMGIPDADIMELGGWQSDYTMKRIYRHSLQTKDGKKEISKKLSEGLL